MLRFNLLFNLINIYFKLLYIRYYVFVFIRGFFLLECKLVDGRYLFVCFVVVFLVFGIVWYIVSVY